MSTMTTISITCYVSDGDLHEYAGGVLLRRATAAELREAAAVWQAEGAFTATVARRTVVRAVNATNRDPRYLREALRR